ncbi:hypothetical protein Misp01_74640 [Microtetraspora sp. NBRC 13810]|nr:hypothetical protein Misp01_74640 [Microtetraspora sp. NBRC 13810]
MVAGVSAGAATVALVTGGLLEVGLPPPITTVAFILLALPLPFLGWLVSSHRPANRYGWLLLAIGCCLGFMVLGVGLVTRAAAGGPGADALLAVGVALCTMSGLYYSLTWIFVPLLFPDGRPPSPRWRLLGRVGGAAVAVQFVAQFLSPGHVLPTVPAVVNPFGLAGFPGLVALLVNAVSQLVALCCGIAALFSLRTRARGASRAERRRLRWIALGGGVNIVGFVLLLFFNTGGGGLLSAAVGLVSVLSALPAAILLTVIRHRVFDLRLAVRRSVVYGLLWASIAAGYAGVATAFGMAAGERLPVGVAIGLTVLVTLIFQPARARLERLADRIVFGDRPTAADLLSDLGPALEESEPVEQLSRVASAVQAGLGARWAAVTLADGTRVVAGEETGEAVLVLPVPAGLGHISCGPKPGGPVTAEDVRLLRALAVPVALTIQSAGLATRLVNAQEAERRRIERNIHDGVQQQLVALIAGLELARASGGGGPGTLALLREQARQTLNDLRELAAGIHPSVLSQGGLVEAVEERCSRLPVRTTVLAEPGLRERRFPDEVEGAVYLTVSEAVANALKHAAAARIEVRLAHAAGKLEAFVDDDGIGFDRRAVSSAGLDRLADRLAALGGGVDIVSAPGAGTRVRAWVTAHG